MKTDLPYRHGAAAALPLSAIDAELAEGLVGDPRAVAERSLKVPVVRIERGVPTRLLVNGAGRDGLFALLVVEGFALRDVEVDGVPSAELLAPGDVVSAELVGADEMLGESAVAAWRPLGTHVDIARLDRSVLAAARQSPELLVALASRALRRADALAIQAAIANRQRVEERLLLLLRQLGERHGRVTTDGVRIDVPLTHDTLARMVGAHRPSVSAAISALRRRGEVLRPNRGSWLLASRTSAASARDAA